MLYYKRPFTQKYTILYPTAQLFYTLPFSYNFWQPAIEKQALFSSSIEEINAPRKG